MSGPLASKRRDTLQDTMTTSKLTPFVLALSLASLACHGSHSGVVTFVPGPPATIPEIEVNDFAFAPQPIGTVVPGDQLFIEGSITDQGWDPRDGFQLFAAVPMVVSVSLDAHVPGVDLDWCVWDPSVGDYTVCAETEFNPELGSFIVVPPGDEFHMVVSSFSGTSTYTMELTFSTYFGAEASAASNALEEQRPTPRAQDAMDYGEERNDAPGPIFRAELFGFDSLEQVEAE
jgi:hypothetical protein